jgi:hypothetical protein
MRYIAESVLTITPSRTRKTIWRLLTCTPGRSSNGHQLAPDCHSISVALAAIQASLQLAAAHAAHLVCLLDGVVEQLLHGRARGALQVPARLEDELARVRVLHSGAILEPRGALLVQVDGGAQEPATNVHASISVCGPGSASVLRARPCSCGGGLWQGYTTLASSPCAEVPDLWTSTRQRARTQRRKWGACIGRYASFCCHKALQSDVLTVMLR